jgi:hypothetical protein
MFDQIPAVGSCDPSIHSLDETCFVLQIEVQDFLGQFTGVAPLPRGEFSEFRFLLRSEMYFHVFECRYASRSLSMLGKF